MSWIRRKIPAGIWSQEAEVWPQLTVASLCDFGLFPEALPVQIPSTSIREDGQGDFEGHFPYETLCFYPCSLFSFCHKVCIIFTPSSYNAQVLTILTFSSHAEASQFTCTPYVHDWNFVFGHSGNYSFLWSVSKIFNCPLITRKST